MFDPNVLEIRRYDLPDSVLLETDPESKKILVWIPELTAVVMGSSNKPERSLYLDRIMEDRMPVYKRPSGGEAILLSPGTLVISVLKRRGSSLSVREQFISINNKIIDGLSRLGVGGISHDGMSDLSLNGRKILGSAIYQNFERIFYHGVLNVSEKGERIQRYLRHPLREPDYRKGRTHREFVTSLHEQGKRINIKLLEETLTRYI